MEDRLYRAFADVVSLDERARTAADLLLTILSELLVGSHSKNIAVERPVNYVGGAYTIYIKSINGLQMPEKASLFLKIFSHGEVSIEFWSISKSGVSDATNTIKYDPITAPENVAARCVLAASIEAENFISMQIRERLDARAMKCASEFGCDVAATH